MTTLTAAIGGMTAGLSIGLLCTLLWRAAMATALRSARHAATHDPLTGLLNRAGWQSTAPAVLDTAIANRCRAALLVVDLDGFKAINDTHGHPAGDAMIGAAADRIVSVVGDRGIVARLGGDEYAALIICPAIDPDIVAAGIAAQIRAAVARPVGTPTAILTVGASVGIAVLPAGTRRDVDLTAALGRADLAMYRDKDRTYDRTPEVTP